MLISIFSVDEFDSIEYNVHVLPVHLTTSYNLRRIP